MAGCRAPALLALFTSGDGLLPALLALFTSGDGLLPAVLAFLTSGDGLLPALLTSGVSQASPNIFQKSFCC